MKTTINEIAKDYTIFTIGNHTSTFIRGTAVCYADLDEGNTDARQNAILERAVYDDEIRDYIWFGYELPTTAEDIECMADNADAESDYEVCETFSSEVPFKSWDFSGGILAGK